MPTKKIGEVNQPEVCRSPDHTPPMYQVFSPGKYEHTCSQCGKVTFFTVNGPYYGSPPMLPKSPRMICRGDLYNNAGWPKRWSDPAYLGDGPYGP